MTKDELKDRISMELKAGKDMNVATRWHKVADGDLPLERNCTANNGEYLDDNGRYD